MRAHEMVWVRGAPHENTGFFNIFETFVFALDFSKKLLRSPLLALSPFFRECACFIRYSTEARCFALSRFFFDFFAFFSHACCSLRHKACETPLESLTL